MTTTPLRFRQVHLDFHTSPAIPGVGAAFDKAQWQDALRRGHVDSITCFAVCHHGWNYNDTRVGARHPSLTFDLLRAQYDACKEIDVNVPIYLTAGVNNRVAEAHPEWREIMADGKLGGWVSSTIQPGFRKLCFNTPYLDYLCELIRETVRQYPAADGIFLDIIYQGECCCYWCLETMRRHGLDAISQADRLKCSDLALQRYYTATTAAVRDLQPGMRVFHNSGHIPRGRRDLLRHFSHLELESLPTGGWGYDHYPLSAKYCAGLDVEFLGMTGKFHNTWGEFGGYKHPNALRYECAAMLAFGSRCSVGDQLHPNGRMDGTTYDLIGAAYAEVEAKEPWCRNTRNVADIALLSSQAVQALTAPPGAQVRDSSAETGATRILLEGHYLFDVIDTDNDLRGYKLLIVPDDIEIPAACKTAIDRFLAAGGKLLLADKSGLTADGATFLFDTGAELAGQSPFQPDYVLPREDLRPSFVSSPLAMYMKSRRIRATTGTALGDVYDPYFNRTFDHFCSHQHAPARPEPSGFHSGVRKGNVVYLAHPVFSQYATTGAVAHKDCVLQVIDQLLGKDKSLRTNLPSTARVSLMRQPAERRQVLHLLYANTVLRGGRAQLSTEGLVRDTQPVEVIEELTPLQHVQIQLKSDRPVRRMTLEPQGTELTFAWQGDALCMTLYRLQCHQMIALHEEG